MFNKVRIGLANTREFKLRFQDTHSSQKSKPIICPKTSAGPLHGEAREPHGAPGLEHLVALRGQGRPSPEDRLAQGRLEPGTRGHRLPALHGQGPEHDRRCSERARTGGHDEGRQRPVLLHRQQRLRQGRDDDTPVDPRCARLTRALSVDDFVGQGSAGLDRIGLRRCRLRLS